MSDLEKTAHDIHGELLKPNGSTRGFNSTTVAAAKVQMMDGEIRAVAATSQGRFSRDQAVAAHRSGAIPVNFAKIKAPEEHAERNIIDQWVKANGARVLEAAASRPICEDCQVCMDFNGVNPVSPRKRLSR